MRNFRLAACFSPGATSLLPTLTRSVPIIKGHGIHVLWILHSGIHLRRQLLGCEKVSLRSPLRSLLWNYSGASELNPRARHEWRGSLAWKKGLGIDLDSNPSTGTSTGPIPPFGKFQKQRYRFLICKTSTFTKGLVQCLTLEDNEVL